MSISFGIACAATSLSVVYTAWNGWKTLKNDTNKSIEELTAESLNLEVLTSKSQKSFDKGFEIMHEMYVINLAIDFVSLFWVRFQPHIYM